MCTVFIFFVLKWVGDSVWDRGWDPEQPGRCCPEHQRRPRLPLSRHISLLCSRGGLHSQQSYILYFHRHAHYKKANFMHSSWYWGQQTKASANHNVYSLLVKICLYNPVPFTNEHIKPSLQTCRRLRDWSTPTSATTSLRKDVELCYIG